MPRNEIRHEFAMTAARGYDPVELCPQLLEQPERRLGHQFEHTVLGMLGSHFQSSGSVFKYKFPEIRIRGIIHIPPAIEKKVISYAAAYICVPYAAYLCNTLIEPEKPPV